MTFFYSGGFHDDGDPVSVRYFSTVDVPWSYSDRVGMMDYPDFFDA